MEPQVILYCTGGKQNPKDTWKTTTVANWTFFFIQQVPGSPFAFHLGSHGLKKGVIYLEPD